MDNEKYITTVIVGAFVVFFLPAAYWFHVEKMTAMTATTTTQYINNVTQTSAYYNGERLGHCALVPPPCKSFENSQMHTIDITLPLQPLSEATSN